MNSDSAWPHLGLVVAKAEHEGLRRPLGNVATKNSDIANPDGRVTIAVIAVLSVRCAVAGGRVRHLTGPKGSKMFHVEHRADGRRSAAMKADGRRSETPEVEDP